MAMLLLVQWFETLEDAAKSGKPVAVLRAPARGESLDAADAFARVFVRSPDSELRLYDAKGRLLSRTFAPDRAAIRDELAWALEETGRAKPRDIPLPAEGRRMIGQPAPERTPDGWLRESGDLSGRVVLVRFFTNTCPFCAASMPALQGLHQKYQDRGLTVVGFYHPKPFGTKRSRESVEKMLDEWKITFPIALDTGWTTLNRTWLDAGPRSATSASFLIDRKGVVRWIHPGPELHPGDHPECARDYAELEAAVEKLLSEK
jgi:thiol-disulfide isomerase/thioredoxin